MGSLGELELENRAKEAGEREKKEGKTLVVGIRTDSRSRELLTWALVNVAVTGDRVVAVHVLRFASSSAADIDLCVEELEPMRRAYEGFCSLRQIDLMIKVCRGFSVRRTLVRQVRSFSAAHLILGESKGSRAIRTSLTSIPKYCSKRLSPECSIVAVNNGKIVFGRGVLGGQNSSKSDSSAVSTSVVSLEKEETQTEEAFKPSRSLLRWPVITHRKTNSIDGSAASLLHWAKRISSRSSTSSPVDFVGRHTRSDTSAEANRRMDLCLSPFHDGEGNLQMKLQSLQEKCASFCKLFSYKELVQATCNFSPDRLIGKGGSSQVYKGTLPDGKELAVKVLKPSKDSLKVFLLEIDIITTLSHKNVISLLGFCFEEKNLMLINDLFPRGSLQKNLHGPEERRCSLGWSDRFKISMGLAEALNYLHGDDDAKAVIHLDVKSSNVLLSENFEPKLSDFGLATRSTASVSQMLRNGLTGTFGYLAPECFMFGQVSTKTDVYAFGVVLLELISGRKPISTGGIRSDESLVVWAKLKLQSGKALELADPSLNCEYDHNQMERTVLAASLCLKKDSRSRPSMSHVKFQSFLLIVHNYSTIMA
ncbi:putative receptor-like serine/threonine-protein kinase [Apostasia shenzhenica]|uniref:Putative receptor-like serine/threonine-protein kinase n=1 Tax=Apostasia shenzhenica TaxID=1088818 RepID=A0A2H9ZXF5_9ASPA|nr:putative receptor-like serine/threonine-protein kinase [Apostasia shenzhenica]